MQGGANQEQQARKAAAKAHSERLKLEQLAALSATLARAPFLREPGYSIAARPSSTHFPCPSSISLPHSSHFTNSHTPPFHSFVVQSSSLLLA